VRNPINAIMLSLQVIEDDLEEGDPNHKWIDNIRDECNKLMYLMESVLSFAKPLEYKMAGVDLNFLALPYPGKMASQADAFEYITLLRI
jgi:signal transduction histidine kinase